MRLLFTLIIFVSLINCGGPRQDVEISTGMSLRHERRDSAAILSDETIESIATMKINSIDDLSNTDNFHINVSAYNGLALVTGETTNTRLRDKIISLVRVIPNVKLVHNEIIINPTKSFSSRSSDTYLTTKVKSALKEVDNLPGFDSNMIKVTTANSVVYLMGIVHQAEGQAVAKRTQHVDGVVKIVTLFEYID